MGVGIAGGFKTLTGTGFANKESIPIIQEPIYDSFEVLGAPQFPIKNANNSNWLPSVFSGLAVGPRPTNIFVMTHLFHNYILFDIDQQANTITEIKTLSFGSNVATQDHYMRPLLPLGGYHHVDVGATQSQAQVVLYDPITQTFAYDSSILSSTPSPNPSFSTQEFLPAAAVSEDEKYLWTWGFSNTRQPIILRKNLDRLGGNPQEDSKFYDFSTEQSPLTPVNQRFVSPNIESRNRSHVVPLANGRAVMYDVADPHRFQVARPRIQIDGVEGPRLRRVPHTMEGFVFPSNIVNIGATNLTGNTIMVISGNGLYSVYDISNIDIDDLAVAQGGTALIEEVQTGTIPNIPADGNRAVSRIVRINSRQLLISCARDGTPPTPARTWISLVTLTPAKNRIESVTPFFEISGIGQAQYYARLSETRFLLVGGRAAKGADIWTRYIDLI